MRFELNFNETNNVINKFDRNKCDNWIRVKLKMACGRAVKWFQGSRERAKSVTKTHRQNRGHDRRRGLAQQEHTIETHAAEASALLHIIHLTDQTSPRAATVLDRLHAANAHLACCSNFLGNIPLLRPKRLRGRLQVARDAACGEGAKCGWRKWNLIIMQHRGRIVSTNSPQRLQWVCRPTLVRIYNAYSVLHVGIQVSVREDQRLIAICRGKWVAKGKVRAEDRGAFRDNDGGLTCLGPAMPCKSLHATVAWSAC